MKERFFMIFSGMGMLVKRGLSPLFLTAFLLFGLLLGVVGVWPSVSYGTAEKKEPAQKTTKEGHQPGLTIQTTVPLRVEWPLIVPASGSIFAWQEAVVGSEISGFRLSQVLVDIGDRVVKGQLLAKISDLNLLAEKTEVLADLDAAKSAFSVARLNEERVKALKATGALSSQEIDRYLSETERTKAQVESRQARLQLIDLKLAQTKILAPDDGIISSRAATLGSVVNAGAELFRLIRDARLEWRAEVPEAQLAKIPVGAKATLTLADGSTASATVRVVSPVVDVHTRNGLVFADLPIRKNEKLLRAGMFAHGQFQFSAKTAVALPQSSLVLQDGHAYVFRVDEGMRVHQVQVELGRRVGEAVEILSGIKLKDRFVLSGGVFLTDGESVQIVD